MIMEFCFNIEKFKGKKREINIPTLCQFDCHYYCETTQTQVHNE
jgi:hypothetical protein